MASMVKKDASYKRERQATQKKRVRTRIASRLSLVVPVAGVEPAPCCQDRILSPARLPIPSHRLSFACRQASPAGSVLIITRDAEKIK